MRPSVNQLAVWGVCALLSSPWATSPAVAEPPPASAAERWVPSFGIAGGWTFQEQASSVESHCENGGPGDGLIVPVVSACSVIPTPANPASPGPLRPTVSDSDWAVAPYVGFNLGLMTPRIPIPGSPRVFAFGEILPSFGAKRNIASEGQPSSPVPPGEGVPRAPVADLGPTGFFSGGYNQLAIQGVGSRTTSTLDTLVYGAGLGIAFPFRWRERQLRIKPSAGWLSYSMAVEGIVVTAVKDDRPSDGSIVGYAGDIYFGPTVRDCTFSPDVFAPVSVSCPGTVLTGGTSKRFNAIGPGLEVEMDAARWGPVGISLFVGGSAYYVLGDRAVKFSTTQDFAQELGVDPSDPRGDIYRPPVFGLPADTYTANWSFEVDPWMFRAGAGIRFHWLGNIGAR